MQLVQSEKMAAVGQLASGVIHDLKTPMMVIVGYADMLRRKLEKMPLEDAARKQLNEYLDYIAQGVGHSDDVVKNLLLFARPSEPKRVPTDLNKLLDETVAFLQPEFRRSGVIVNQERGKNLPKVPIDPSQVKQVFINILINAVQAMERRNHLKISTDRELRDGREGVLAHFVDTGQGMTPEQLAQVVAPF